MTQIFSWWLTLQLFGLAGLPLARWLFRALPDRGYAFGKSLGLLLSGYLAWLLAMLGLAPFGRGLLLACALTVGLGGWWLTRATRDSGAIQNLKRSTQNWPRIAAYELLFLAALGFVALLRSYQPDPWGTERPMDYALFNAIRVSTNFPPHDPWLAGFSINYYYFGYLLMAALALVSGVGEGTAYNLALAAIFALSALGIAGLVLNLIELARGQDREAERYQSLEADDKTQNSVAIWLAALLAVVLVLGVGNQGGAAQLISGTPRVLELAQTDFVRALANGMGARAPLALAQPYVAWGDRDTTSSITPENMVANFNWWNPSRALWDSGREPGDPTRYYTITEFPFFSFWLGDMHPHVMSLPFGLLALALALATLARPAAPAFTSSRRGWLELALTGVVLGSLYLINSWDLPTYLLLYLGALLLLYVRLGAAGGPHAAASSSGPIARLAGIWWLHYLNQVLPVLVATWVLFAPFHLTFRSLVGGDGFPLGVVTWSRTQLHSFLVIFGLFLAPLLAFVLLVGRRRTATARLQLVEQPDDANQMPDEAPDDEAGKTEDEKRKEVLRFALRPSSFVQSVGESPLLRFAPWVALGALVVGLAIGFPLLALLPLAVYAIGLAIERAERPADAFALWAFALVCLVCFGTELVYIRDVFNSRMNTIFKFYYQAWLIWGMLAGYAAWWLVSGKTKGEGPPTKALRTPPWSFALRRSSLAVVCVVFLLLLAGALVYPALTAGKIFRDGQRIGLDGKTPPEKAPDSAAAIEWIRANTPGDALVLEAVGDDYDGRGIGVNGVSASTGRPTVLGWPGHEDQWRGGDPAVRAQIGPRRDDVTAIYSGADMARARELLGKYGVDYIYVGAAERASYPPEGLAKIGELGEVAFQQGDVFVYRVR